MDLRDLRYFETIARLEHLGKASEQLHRTQPALTECIRRLESECGAPLFERAGRGIRLTAAGSVLLKWAHKLRFDAEDAQREMASIGRGLSGQVRLGVVPTAAQFMLPRVARQLLEQAPDVTLKAQIGIVDAMHPLLLAGELDLVVGTEMHNAPDLVAHYLDEDAIVVVTSATHPLFQRQAPLQLADLAHEQWILQPPGAPTRDWLDHTFDRHWLPRPRVKIESSMLITTPLLIAETGLLSFVSRRHLDESQHRAVLREVPVPDATMMRRLVISHRRDAFLSAAAQRVLALFRDLSDNA